MPTMDPAADKHELARRNVRTALFHAVLAAGVLALFVWSMVHK